MDVYALLTLASAVYILCASLADRKVDVVRFRTALPIYLRRGKT